MSPDFNNQNTDGTQGPEIAVRFLQQLRPDGPWVLSAIIPDGPITTATVHTAAEVDAFVKTHNGTRNIYYSVNPTRKAISKKATKADIAAVEYLLADCDPNAGETSDDAKTRYLKQLNDFEPQPTALVDSGNGIQCLWGLTQRIELPTDAADIINDVETRTAEIMVRLGAKPGTQNIDRILRLPGTINLPNEKKRKEGRTPCATKLISFNGVSYDLNAFPLPEHLKSDENKTNTDEADDLDKLERIIRLGENGEFEGDRSTAVWYVVCEMLRRGYMDSTIVSTLLDHANKISDHIYAQSAPRAYALRQIAKAKEKIKPIHTKIEILPNSQWFGERPKELPAALIKGVLPQTGVAMIGGQSGGGKTFHAIHLGTCLIPDCKQNFYIDKYRIKRKGGVLYFVLEGKAAFQLRCTTAFETMLNKQMQFGDRYRLPWAWNTYEPMLFHKGPDPLIKLVERDAQKMRQEFDVDLVAIFLDTMGLAACYDNEDRASEIQKVVSGLFKLSDVTGALAIGIDHFGKDQSLGLRGSSAKRGHVETVLACLVDRDKEDKISNRRMKFEKIRDGEEGRIIPYKLKVVDLGKDEDQEPITTCLIEWEPNRPQPSKKRPSKIKTNITMQLAINEVGGLPAEYEVLRKTFYKHHRGTDNAANHAWHRAVEDMELELFDGALDYKCE
jgi:hypothetical protein